MDVVLVAPVEIRAVQVFHDFSDEALQFRGKPGPGSEGVILELGWVWAWEANRILCWEPSWRSFRFRGLLQQGRGRVWEGNSVN